MSNIKEKDYDENYDRRQKSFDEKFCTSCGSIIKKEAELCVKCGVRQTSSKPLKSKVTAGVLAILLGGIGAHKFYVGKIGLGILYFLFSWTFIPAAIGFIEGIIYFVSTKTDEEFTAKYV